MAIVNTTVYLMTKEAEHGIQVDVCALKTLNLI